MVPLKTLANGFEVVDIKAAAKWSEEDLYIAAVFLYGDTPQQDDYFAGFLDWFATECVTRRRSIWYRRGWIHGQRCYNLMFQE
jgi:hypothetical protein